jgi:putative DNA primase/helicase
MSLRMATQMSVPAFVAFDAGGLLALAKVVRELYPNARLIFCADDDYKTYIRGQHVNVGRKKAKSAAWEVGGAMKKSAGVIYPIFKKRTNEKWTDFNDLHVVDGLDAVTRQLSTIGL